MSENGRCLDDVRKFLQSSKGLSPQKRMEFYDIWAETYEKDSTIMQYSAPNQVVNFLHPHFKGDRENIRVLDVACGSGLVAKLMSKKGFKSFDGVDGSKGMLDLAAKSGLYQHVYLAILGTDQLPGPKNAYDLVMIIGALRAGFVPVSVIRELYQATKPGGFICMSRVDTKSQPGEEYKRCMEKELQQMVDDGLLSLVATGEINKYMMDVYVDHDKDEDEKYLHGSIYLYKKASD